MIKLKDRQKDILGSVVKEYTKTARPVASSELIREFRLKISPATIRNEMLELDRLGYLYQPYTSAGRVPTDRGYRFFIDYLLEDAPLPSPKRNILKDAFEQEDKMDFTCELTRLASDLTKNLVLCGLKEGVLHKTGFSRLLKEPEFNSGEMVKSLGNLLDRLDEEMDVFMAGLKGEDTVYVGEENPFEEGRGLSMVVSKWRHPGGFQGFLTLIGPKRMDYQSNKSFINFLRNI